MEDIFEARKDRLYKQAASLLADHRDDPYFLSRVLSLLSCAVDPVTRQRVLFALEDAVGIDEDPGQQESISRSRGSVNVEAPQVLSRQAAKSPEDRYITPDDVDADADTDTEEQQIQYDLLDDGQKEALRETVQDDRSRLIQEQQRLRTMIAGLKSNLSELESHSSAQPADRKLRVERNLLKESKLSEYLQQVDDDLDEGYLNSGAILQAAEMILQMSDQELYSRAALDDIKRFISDIIAKKLPPTSPTFVAFELILDETVSHYLGKRVDDIEVFDKLMSDVNELVFEVLMLASRAQQQTWAAPRIQEIADGGSDTEGIAKADPPHHTDGIMALNDASTEQGSDAEEEEEAADAQQEEEEEEEGDEEDDVENLEELTPEELMARDMDIAEMRQVQLHLARKLQVLEYERREFLKTYGIDLNASDDDFQQQLENLRQELDETEDAQESHKPEQEAKPDALTASTRADDSQATLATEQLDEATVSEPVIAPGTKAFLADGEAALDPHMRSHNNVALSAEHDVSEPTA